VHGHERFGDELGDLEPERDIEVRGDKRIDDWASVRE
jgi:hypothetical protein